MPSFEEIESILNAPWYVPPSKWNDGTVEPFAKVCPYCGGKNSYFSGLFLAWICKWCDGIFDLEEAG